MSATTNQQLIELLLARVAAGSPPVMLIVPAEHHERFRAMLLEHQVPEAAFVLRADAPIFRQAPADVDTIASYRARRLAAKRRSRELGHGRPPDRS